MLTVEARRAKWRQYYRRHPDRSKQRRIKSRSSNVEFVDSFKTACAVCGNDDKRVLDFHHMRDKDRDVATLRRAGYSKKRILAEIQKCVVLCANCHRLAHWIERYGMKYSQTGLHLTEQFEGCKLTAYRDQVGVLTIGYGHTRGVYEGMTCTQAQADAWLLEDLQVAIQNVNTHVKISVTQEQFDALVDFAFNCGCGNLDSSTLLKLVNAGDFEHAAAEFEKWDHAGGKVVAGLLKRRKAEEAEFLQGSTAAPQIDNTLPPVPGIPIPADLQ